MEDYALGGGLAAILLLRTENNGIRFYSDRKDFDDNAGTLYRLRHRRVRTGGE